MDYCLHSADQAKVEAVADDTATDVDETAAEIPAAYVTCQYFKEFNVGPTGDIRTAAATENGLSYEAWAWGTGEALPNKVAAAAAAAAEGDADSAKMITSALAAIATIAMVAY